MGKPNEQFRDQGPTIIPTRVRLMSKRRAMFCHADTLYGNPEGCEIPKRAFGHPNHPGPSMIRIR